MSAPWLKTEYLRRLSPGFSSAFGTPVAQWDPHATSSSAGGSSFGHGHSTASSRPTSDHAVKVLSGDHGTSVLACLKATLRAEGVAGLFRGFVPAVCRQCPVILVQMPLIEQVRKLAGLGHM